MPKSWLYSENGILIQEKYINSVTENDIIVKNKSKSSVKPPRKSKENGSNRTSNTEDVRRINVENENVENEKMSRKGLAEDNTQTSTFEQFGSTQRRMFTGSLKNMNIQKRVGWMTFRKKLRSKFSKPWRSSMSLNGLVGRKGEEYRWEIQLSPDKSRPVSLIFPDHCSTDNNSSDIDIVDNSSNKIEKVRVVSKIIPSTSSTQSSQESPLTIKKGLDEFESLERTMFIQELKQIRRRSRRILSEPISEEAEFTGFSNEIYSMELFPRNYENVPKVSPKSVEMVGNGMRITGTAVVPDYENIETADLPYENEEVWKNNQSYKKKRAKPTPIQIDGGDGDDDDDDDDYENFDFKDVGIYQDLYFGKMVPKVLVEKTSDSQSAIASAASIPTAMNSSTLEQIDDFISTIDQVNKLVSKKTQSKKVVMNKLFDKNTFTKENAADQEVDNTKKKPIKTSEKSACFANLAQPKQPNKITVSAFKQSNNSVSNKIATLMSRQQNNLTASITKPNIIASSLTKPNITSQPKPNNMAASFIKPTQTFLSKPNSIVVSLAKPNNMATSVSKTNKTNAFSQNHPSNKLFLPDLQINNNHQGRSKKVNLDRGEAEFSEEEKKIVADFLQQCVLDIQQIKAGESNC